MKKNFFVRKILIWLSILFVIAAGIFLGRFLIKKYRPQESIKVGILHSLTGTMAFSERSVVDATMLAIEEINQKGGVLGKKIQPIIVDGKSDWPTFAEQAEKLITQEKVNVVFGCWTSASRKIVKPVFEKYRSLLFYPVQYEGLEESQNIVYTGAAPNQQILPAVTWCFNNLGKKFFIVGSDYVFPRAANEIIKDQLQALGGKVVGEHYIPLGSNEVAAVIKEIMQKKPDVILNSINGDSNRAFFQELRKAGVTPEKIPVMSFSIAEQELFNLKAESMIGDYAVWSYFQSIRGKTNDDFVQAFKKKYGQDRVVSDPMEAAYFGVHIWADAVNEAQSLTTDDVRTALKNQSYNAPEGIVSIEPLTQHTWKFIRIGKITSNNQFSVIWDSERAVKPVPYPPYRDKNTWDAFLNGLYEQWGKQWAKS
jgi:urea transport system substrate-binding protein